VQGGGRFSSRGNQPFISPKDWEDAPLLVEAEFGIVKMARNSNKRIYLICLFVCIALVVVAITASRTDWLQTAVAGTSLAQRPL